MTMTSNRVLVHITRAADQSPQKLKFIQSVVNLLNESDSKDDAVAYTKVENGHYIISNKKLNGFNGPVYLKRPPFCPIHNISSDEAESIPQEIQERGIDSGAAVLVESSDGKILLIRRALHLRTFPGVWVPPGGHIEVGEQVQEAAFRELHEETGIRVTLEMCENGRSPILALWESSFPPMLGIGIPIRHHIVTYLHVKLKAPHTSHSVMVNPDPEEVGAAAWMDLPLLTAIVDAHEKPLHQPDMSASQLNLPQTTQITMVERGIPNYTMNIKTDTLLQTAKEDEPDRERVSSGTIWALKQWLKAKI